MMSLVNKISTLLMKPTHPFYLCKILRNNNLKTLTMLWLGTLVFLALGIGAHATAHLWGGSQTGLLKILLPVAAFCLWLSYALIYMAQINPLLLPTRNIKAE